MQVLYKETCPSKGITVILGLFTLVILAMAIFSPLKEDPVVNWILISTAILFVLLTINFSFITILLSDSGVKVSYGIFSSSLPWKEISNCETDQKNYFYGWGLRFGKYKKNWIWIYNVIGGQRVVFLTDRNKPKGLMVSTQNPQEIIDIAKGQIGKR